MVNENLAQRTKQSPRFENGILCIYEGDTFDLQLDLNLTRDGEAIDVQPTDVVTLEFRNVACKTGDVITTVDFTEITDNQIILHWDNELTAKFPKGKYAYRMKYNAEYITTLVADNIIWVS